MAIMGNLTYGTSLLLRPLSMVYFVSKLPWLVTHPPFSASQLHPPPLRDACSACRWAACACASSTSASCCSSSSTATPSLCPFKFGFNLVDVSINCRAFPVSTFVDTNLIRPSPAAHYRPAPLVPALPLFPPSRSVPSRQGLQPTPTTRRIYRLALILASERCRRKDNARTHQDLHFTR